MNLRPFSQRLVRLKMNHWKGILLLGGLGLVGYGLWLIRNAPDPSLLKGCTKTAHGSVRLCRQAPTYVPLRSISKEAVAAILISEDARFYLHNGFDWDEIKNTLQSSLSEGRLIRGASTITQQLARVTFLGTQKTLRRKFLEAYLAWKLEQNFNKSFILERYLNAVELGRGIFGIRQASYHYFNKHPSQLTALEGSYLAYLLPNPPIYSNTFRQGELTDYARKRILTILEKLYLTKKIPESEWLWSQTQIDHFPWF